MGIAYILLTLGVGVGTFWVVIRLQAERFRLQAERSSVPAKIESEDPKQRRTTILIAAGNLLAATILTLFMMMHPPTNNLILGTGLLTFVVSALSLSVLKTMKPTAASTREIIRQMSPAQQAFLISSLVYLALALVAICFAIPGVISDTIKALHGLGMP
jgi:hypothetical protein